MIEVLKAVRYPLFGFAVLLSALAMRLMNFEMRKDEQLYVPPVRLLDGQSPYVDFFYNHTPVSAWYMHGVMNALGTDMVLLSGRIAVLLGWAIFGLALIAVTYRLTRSQVMTMLALTFVFANGALLNQTGMAATNNLLVLVATYLGLGLFVLAVTGRRISGAAAASAGFALSLAAGTKASAFIFIPIVALTSMMLPNWANLSTRLAKVTLPLAVGGILGALPVLYYLARDPDRFLAHVVGFHTGPHVAYWLARVEKSDETVALTATSKAMLAADIWLSGANVAMLLVILTILTSMALSESIRHTIRRAMTGEAAFAAICLVAAMAMSFVPTPGFPQYYTMPLACVPIFMAVLFTMIKEAEREVVRATAIASTVISLAIASPQLLQFVPRVLEPSSWTVTKTHSDGMRIAQVMSDARVQGKVATLLPIYALEGGLPVYVEFATGQFAYRTAPFTDPSLKAHFRTTSPEGVSAFLAKDPPAAILTGFEPELEKPLVDFALQNGYKLVDGFTIDDRYGSGVIYVRTTQ